MTEFLVVVVLFVAMTLLSRVALAVYRNYGEIPTVPYNAQGPPTGVTRAAGLGGGTDDVSRRRQVYHWGVFSRQTTFAKRWKKSSMDLFSSFIPTRGREEDVVEPNGCEVGDSYGFPSGQGRGGVVGLLSFISTTSVHAGTLATRVPRCAQEAGDPVDGVHHVLGGERSDPTLRTTA